MELYHQKIDITSFRKEPFQNYVLFTFSKKKIKHKELKYKSRTTKKCTTNTITDKYRTRTSTNNKQQELAHRIIGRGQAQRNI